MINKYYGLEKNNIELQKMNWKLQNRMEKIVSKNKIKISNNITNNTQNTANKNISTNLIINNPNINLVDFGKEDLVNLSHQIFIDALKSQGYGLYNKAIEGIHFNKDYPENQNIYISDINREKVMVYKDEKWLLDNWTSIFNDLLAKVIQFGYDKEEFLSDCNYKIDNNKYNEEMIKKGMRWFKLLDDYEPDVEYFSLEPEDRPQIQRELLIEYEEMIKFRKAHPKKETTETLKNKTKINMYNKKDIPINNYRKIIGNDCDNKNKFIE